MRVGRLADRSAVRVDPVYRSKPVRADSTRTEAECAWIRFAERSQVPEDSSRPIATSCALTRLDCSRFLRLRIQDRSRRPALADRSRGQSEMIDGFGAGLPESRAGLCRRVVKPKPALMAGCMSRAPKAPGLHRWAGPPAFSLPHPGRPRSGNVGQLRPATVLRSIIAQSERHVIEQHAARRDARVVQALDRFIDLALGGHA